MDCGNGWYHVGPILTFLVCSCMCLAGTYDSNSPYDSRNVEGLLAVAGFTAQGSTGRRLSDVWFHHNPAACIDTVGVLRTLCRHGVGGLSFPPMSIDLLCLDPREWQWCGCQYACCIGARLHQPMMCTVLRTRHTVGTGPVGLRV